MVDLRASLSGSWREPDGKWSRTVGLPNVLARDGDWKLSIRAKPVCARFALLFDAKLHHAADEAENRAEEEPATACGADDRERDREAGAVEGLAAQDETPREHDDEARDNGEDADDRKSRAYETGGGNGVIPTTSRMP